MNTQELINKLTEIGSFNLTQNEEFNNLPRIEKNRVRMIVRFNLLQNY